MVRKQYNEITIMARGKTTYDIYLEKEMTITIYNNTKSIQKIFRSCKNNMLDFHFNPS